ncbi:MAG: OB-fold domain-containing protein [Pseudorhodoferax sp.]
MPSQDTSPSVAASPLETYRAHLRAGKLAYQYSADAGRAVFFPRLVCPYGGRAPLVWRVSAGLGVVHATTVVFPREGAPYNVALIDLDEGFRMMSRVEGVAPEQAAIGLRVRVDFVADDKQPAPLPVFRPLAEVAA